MRNIPMWTDRWFQASESEARHVLYLIFGLFSLAGMVIFSVFGAPSDMWAIFNNSFTLSLLIPPVVDYSVVSLNPWWITGFVDGWLVGEGCFRISIFKNKEVRTQWGVKAVYLWTNKTNGQ